MNEVDLERRRRAEELLLRSAQLDAPRPAERARVLARVLAESRPSPRGRQARALGFTAGALALAAGAALLLARGTHFPARESAQAEPPRVARSTGSAASSAPAPTAPPPCPKLVVAKGGAPMIDDFEDRNARLLIADGREGIWMVYNDGSGKQVPPGLSPMHPVRLAPNRGESHYALHTTGEKLSIWGSTVVATFTDRGCYDVSAYRGVEFWARGNTRIHVQLALIDEIAKENGGLCAAAGCSTSPSKAFDLGPKWQKYAFSFAELERLNQPPRVFFDPKRVVSFNFGIHREDTPFDVWMDDVRFVESE